MSANSGWMRLKEAQGVPVSEVVRRLIDEAWEAMRCWNAVWLRLEQLIAMDGRKTCPIPDTLSRELNEDLRAACV